MLLVKQSTATHLAIYVVEDDHLTPKTGLVSGDFTVKQISKNAGAFGALTLTITERAYGWYDVTLASGDVDTLGMSVVHLEAVGIDAVDIAMLVIAFDLSSATVTPGAGSITAAVIADGAIDAATFAAGAITATVVADGAIDAATFAANAITAAVIADGAIDAATFAAGAVNAAAIADGAIDAATFAAGAINAAAVADGTIDAATFAAGAINAAAIATDAIGSDELAASAVTKIVNGVLAGVIDGARTIKGVLTRLDAVLKGKATGLNSVLATFYKDDGITKAVEATQDPDLGTRDAASTAAGD